MLTASEFSQLFENQCPDYSPAQIAVRVVILFLEADRQGVELDGNNMVDLHQSLISRWTRKGEQLEAITEAYEALARRQSNGAVIAPEETLETARKLYRVTMDIHGEMSQMADLLQATGD